jgi:hypothetical protein
MSPITNYELGKARHQELEAEFAQYHDAQLDQFQVRLSNWNRLNWEIVSIVIGILLIVSVLVN